MKTKKGKGKARKQERREYEQAGQRTEAERVREKMDSMSYEKKGRDPLDGYGMERGEKKPDAYLDYEDFKERANRLSRICCLCWEVLVANDLREEAYEYVSEHIDEVLPFEWLDCGIAQ